VSAPSAGAVAELVRLPALLSVPGDVLVGAAASGQTRDVPRAAGLIGSSACFYMAGMALNDYADRDEDARERPTRPIPSGRVTPRFALGLAAGLTATGTALAVGTDGARALALAAPLAGAVWAYDLVLKRTAAGPPGMSACRSLDVLMGAGTHGVARALPAAGVVGAHTAVVTTVSRSEVEGAGARLGWSAVTATAAVAAATVRVAASRSRSRLRRVAALGLVGGYALACGRAHADAARDPSPERIQRAVGAGVLGLMLLEASLLAGAGALVPAGGVAALWPLARSLARRRSVT
jgi:UbiA prenyltransferase family